MEKDNIFSFDTLCPEIGVKARKNFQADYQKKENNSHQRADTPSTDKCYSKTITGVYFNDLEPIPFNFAVDPEPGSCFNCWEQGHSREECPKSKQQDFCYNCGRRDVRVSNCPRCSRTYVGYWKKSCEENERPRCLSSCGSNDDTPKSLKADCNKKNDVESKYFVQSIDNEAEDECFSIDESGYYEDLVVDEAKKSLKYTGPFIEDFLKLMDAIKHLPIETQNTVILRFVEDRHLLTNKGGMLVIKIPYYKIWDSCQHTCHSLFDYICKFGKSILSKFTL